VFTVNNSIAHEYEKKYNKKLRVLRNVPSALQLAHESNVTLPSFLESKPYAILQGAGINVDRGAEELVEAMISVENLNLLIVGSGDVLPKLKQMVLSNGLQDKVFFIGKLPYLQLMQYTRGAAFGITLDKDTNLNYRFSLPNKIFDYAAAGIPVLASSLVETRRIMEQYSIGLLVESHEPLHIAQRMFEMVQNPDLVKQWKQNALKLSKENNWELEVQELVEIYQRQIRIS
jgi:glycosyltransferase involved in cell wall biosynthesis